MRKISPMSFLAALALVVAGCGGGDDAFQNPDDPDDPNAPAVASVEVLASSPQLLSDNSAPVTITARVLNEANQAVADVSVFIQTSSGVLTDIQAVTNESGIATAVLGNSGDFTNRTITVTATAGEESDTVQVNVTGTRLTLPATVSIGQGDSTDSIITLVDSGGDGISGETVTVESSAGNSLSATSLTTDPNGQAVVTVTGTVAGTDTLTVGALGLTATQSISVTDDNFAFTAPANGAEIELDDPSTLGAVENNTVARVTWSVGGVAQANEDIDFATTRGTLYEYSGGCTTTLLADSVTTDASGVATVCIASTNAGLATLSASTSTATVAQRPIEFVATDADSMNLQASPNTVTAGGQSTITAVVRDPSNNLVKSKAVVFTLTDVTGGTLSVGSAVTDSQGRAQTIYTASSTTSASNGVVINATVQGTSVSGSTSLTVARRELFISLGTGNEIEEPNPAQYVIPYLIIVTDANGVGVANVDLTVRVNSLWYGTGVLDFNTTWQVGTPFNPYVDVCMDEDLILGAGGPEYRNGILDAGEDQNFNGTLEAGNIAAVRPRALEDGDPRPTTITTNADGLAMIDVVYPQEYAYWVKVELSASTAVQGTESARTVSFSLPGAADDYSTETTSPPGLVSPFGIADYSCSDPDTFP